MRPLLRLLKLISGSSWCFYYYPISVVKESSRVGTIKVAISFLIFLFNSASYVHFRVFFMFFGRRFSLDHSDFDYTVELI